MTTILTVILVCAASVAGPDCDRTTAVDIIVQPAETVAGCQLQGQETAARVVGAHAPGVTGAGHYVKIGCERRTG